MDLHKWICLSASSSKEVQLWRATARHRGAPVVNSWSASGGLLLPEPCYHIWGTRRVCVAAPRCPYMGAVGLFRDAAVAVAASPIKRSGGQHRATRSTETEQLSPFCLGLRLVSNGRWKFLVKNGVHFHGVRNGKVVLNCARLLDFPN